jgi:hypothetical protein
MNHIPGGWEVGKQLTLGGSKNEHLVVSCLCWVYVFVFVS